MIDLTKITADVANKIEVALLQMHKHIVDTIEAYDKLSKDEYLSAECKKTMESNRDWWKDAYDLIYQERKW